MHPIGAYTGDKTRASILRRLGRRPCLDDDGCQASHLVIPLAAGRERTDEGQIDQGGGILGAAPAPAQFLGRLLGQHRGPFVLGRQFGPDAPG